MRIKVTGYVETDNLPPEFVDESHPMGVSDAGYTAYSTGHAIVLDEIEFEAMDLSPEAMDVVRKAMED
jgi:hypothetical protein